MSANREKVSFWQELKSNFLCLFSLQDIDEHYVIKLFGIKFCKKHSFKFDEIDITEKGVNETKREYKVIVSLTTFPARINFVHKTISALLNQTFKSDSVVLWLAEEQFPDKKLPETLLNLQKYGLEIRWCEDIRSFKKLVPSLREFPNDIIVTADDDIFYPSDWLENLYNLYLRYPNCICANRAFMVKKGKEKYYMTSRNYCYNKSFLPRFKNEFMTGYGTLFPPHSLNEEVLNSKIFMKEIPTNDDIWFWGMAVRNGTKIVVNPNGYKLKLVENKEAQEFCLKNLNRNDTTVGMSGRDGVNLMCKLYPEIKDNLEGEKRGY